MTRSVMLAFTQLYGHRFTSAWSVDDVQIWDKVIGEFSTIAVKEALDFLLKGDHAFEEYPPNPIQFRKICAGINAEKTKRTGKKLNTICEICGKPGREIKEDKIKNSYCFDCYCEKKNIVPLVPHQLDKQFPVDDSVPEPLRTHHKMRREAAYEVFNQYRRNYEGC